MATKTQRPLVEIIKSEYDDTSDKQHPCKVYSLTIITRKSGDKVEQAPARVQITRNGVVTTTTTSDDPETPGTWFPEDNPIRLCPGDKDVVFDVLNLTHGGKAHEVLKAPPEQKQQYKPKPGTIQHGFWLGRKRGH